MALADEPDANDELRLDAETIRSLVSWAWGSLTPQPLARFNLYEVPVGNDCTVSFLNHVFILRFGPGLEPGADTPPESVIEAITGAYALLEGVAFEWTFLGGMDLEHGQWEGIGYFKWLGRHDDDLPEHDAPSSLAMLRAVRVAEAARMVPGYRLALRDVRAAVRERGDDAFVFAHRAVSDIARAMSHSGRVDGGRCTGTCPRPRTPSASGSDHCRTLATRQPTETTPTLRLSSRAATTMGSSSWPAKSWSPP